MNARNERGSVLMLVVIFSLILCLLGFAVIYMNSLEYLSARQDLLDSRASLLADGGLALGVGFLYYCDARLEDVTDMEIAENQFNFAQFKNTTRGKVVEAMGFRASPGHRHGRQIEDGTYYLTRSAPKRIDNAYPLAWCDVWISSAANNLASAGGPYYYRISSRGLATYGHNGVIDSVKNEEILIKMSSTTATGLYNKGGRYNYNYWVVSGKRFTEQPIERVVH